MPAAEIDVEHVLGEPATRRGRRLDLAHALGPGRIEFRQQRPGPVSGVPVNRERLLLTTRVTARVLVDGWFGRCLAAGLAAGLVAGLVVAGEVVGEQVTGGLGVAGIAGADPVGCDDLGVRVDRDVWACQIFCVSDRSI